MEKITTTTCGVGDGDGDGDDLLLLLPEDFFIQEILMCLPVKSLLRFKSVCKSWRDLIQTPFFIDLHTTTTTSSSSSKCGGTFILQTTERSRGEYGDDIKLYMLSSGSDGEDDNDEDDDQTKKKNKKMVFKVDDLGFLPFCNDFLLQESRMVGSCNGIICLHDPEVLEDHRGCTKQHYSNLRDVSLCNPATRQFRILPKSIPIEERKEYIGNWLEDFIAFGFDIKTKDYKVLRITPLEESKEGGFICRVQVYSLSTDSWRLLEGINYLPVLPTQGRFCNHGIYLNGSYFFVGRKRVLGKMILSFDFTKEIFTTMQLPDNNSSSVLSCMGDKMVVFSRTGIDDCDECDYYDYCGCDGGYEYYDIWVLNEKNGSVPVNKESWTKLHSFQIKRQPHTSPRCISNNGEFALISSGYNDGRTNKLQLFNLVTKEAEKDFLIGTQVCRADVYKESLVSIMGGGNVLLRWQLPTHGTTYKLNLDAPFIDYYRTFGIGLCLTSDTGGCIGVRSLRRINVRDAEQGEALAMLEAIKWAKKLELSPIVIESDSKKCVSFFIDDDDDNNSTYWSSGALSLLTEAKLLLLNSSEIDISFQYSSRSCNYVTDIAAQLGREGLTWTCKDWTANFPGEMVRSLSKDLGLEMMEMVISPSKNLGLETKEGWAPDSELEMENGWASDSGLEIEKGWDSDSGLETEKVWASDSGLETEKGWASE